MLHIVQLEHAAEECILWRVDSDVLFLNDFGEYMFTVRHMLRPVFENTYFTFFLYFKKTWLFTFFKMTYQKVVKSQKQKFSPQSVKMSLQNVYRKFGFKIPWYCTYGDLLAFITRSC